MKERAKILSEEQLWSYANCPVQYDMAYNRKTIPKKPPMFSEYLQPVAAAFFANIMNGKILSGDELKRRWDNICKKNPSIDMKKCLEGISKIMLMYRWAESVQLRILDIAVPFELLFHGQDDERYDIRGEIPVISVNQSNVPELLVIDWGDKHTNQVRTDMNLRYTLECYAYFKHTGKNLGIHVHNVKYSEDSFSYRGKFDYERLKKTVINIGHSIANNIYYPRENPMCVNCHASGACRSWY